MGAERLVLFHNHSDAGAPMVLTPHENRENRWRFHERGWKADDADFLAALVALKPEGLYTTREHIHFGRDDILPPKSLVQLGYNRSGVSILFVGRFENNAIAFPDKGFSFTTTDVQALLDPVEFLVPLPRDAAALH